MREHCNSFCLLSFNPFCTVYGGSHCPFMHAQQSMVLALAADSLQGFPTTQSSWSLEATWSVWRLIFRTCNDSSSKRVEIHITGQWVVYIFDWSGAVSPGLTCRKDFSGAVSTGLTWRKDDLPSHPGWPGGRTGLVPSHPGWPGGRAVVQVCCRFMYAVLCDICYFSNKLFSYSIHCLSNQLLCLVILFVLLMLFFSKLCLCVILGPVFYTARAVCLVNSIQSGFFVFASRSVCMYQNTVTAYTSV